jgi:hypothetical protein
VPAPIRGDTFGFAGRSIQLVGTALSCRRADWWFPRSQRDIIRSSEQALRHSSADISCATRCPKWRFCRFAGWAAGDQSSLSTVLFLAPLGVDAGSSSHEPPVLTGIKVYRRSHRPGRITISSVAMGPISKDKSHQPSPLRPLP